MSPPTRSALFCVPFSRKLTTQRLPHWLKYWPLPAATWDPYGSTILTRTRAPRWTFWIFFAREVHYDGKPPLHKTSKGNPKHPMFWLVRRAIRLRCLLSPTFALSWIGLMNGSLTYRPKTLYPQPVRLDYMHGVSCFPRALAPQEFVTLAQLLSDMIRCVCSSRNSNMAYRHSYTRRC